MAEVVGVLKGHTRKGPRLAFSPDGRTLASIADDRTVRLWHIATQRELLQFQTPDEDQGPYLLEFSPDGRSLAATRVDDRGPITRLHFAPCLAEIAVAEGRDYGAEAGDNPTTWLAVAKALARKKSWQAALDAFNEVARRTANREELAWLRTNALRQRVEVLKRLDRFDEAGTDNCALLGIASRDRAAPPGAIDLSAFYNGTLADAPRLGAAANDLSELPQGIQTFAGTVFDVRGKLHIVGLSPEREWPTNLDRIDGIHIQRRLDRLRFLHAAYAQSKDIPLGERIGHYRIHFANGQAVEIPLLYNQNISDWRALDHLPRELPEAVVAWRGDNPKSRAQSHTDAFRLFKFTWQNPMPDVEIKSFDFVAEHQRTHPFLIALTAE